MPCPDCAQGPLSSTLGGRTQALVFVVVGGAQQELGSLTQAQRSLCCPKTEKWTMSEKQWPGKDQGGASVSGCAADYLQMGVGGVRREVRRSL